MALRGRSNQSWHDTAIGSVMYDVTYKVMFTGDLFPDRDYEEVKANLARLFDVDTRSAASLFSGKKFKIKSNLDLAGARKYLRALANLGALGYIEQEVVQHSEPLPPPLPDRRFTTTGDFDLEAVQKYFEEREARLKAQLEKTAEHKIYTLDVLDDVVEDERQDSHATDVHNVLDAEEVARMLNKN
jgi:hypothetical protein